MVLVVYYHVDRLLDKLGQLKLTQNTLVVLTADHGEMLGAHGLVSKMVFHEEAVRVPVLMRRARWCGSLSPDSTFSIRSWIIWARSDRRAMEIPCVPPLGDGFDQR
jgi:hypothetical protein